MFLKRHFVRILRSGYCTRIWSSYPLKCTCQLILKHYVTNEQQLSAAAMWADIVCEIDHQNVLYHLLPNVIEW